MKRLETNRGFVLYSFTDRYGSECSIQESSLATERAVWLGVDDPSPKILASRARALGIKCTEMNGWVPYPMPADVSISTRMHLIVDQARELLPLLSHFVDHGDLP